MTILRPLLFLLLLVATLVAPAGPGWSQENDKAFIARRLTMLSLVSKAKKAMKAGEYDTAEAHLNRAAALVNEGGFNGTLDFFRPSLNFARLFKRRKRWDEVARFAGFVVAGMGQPPLKALRERVIAEAYYAEALVKLNRRTEAEAVYESAVAGRYLLDGDEGRARFSAWILYEAAKLKSKLNRSDAADYRARVFALYAAGGDILDREYAYLRFKDLSARRDLLEPTGRKVLMPVARDYLAFLDRDGVRIPELDQMSYRAFLCKLYAEVKDYEQALALCQQNETWREAKGKFGKPYYRNGHSIVSILILMKRYDEAEARIDHYARHAKEIEYEGWHDLANIHSVRAFLLKRRGDRNAAQREYRTAYYLFRKIYPANHPRVLRERRRIDTSDPGFAGFLLAAEFADTSEHGPEFSPDASADIVPLWVFSGRTIELEARLKAAKSDDARLWLNRAAAAALLGEFDAFEVAHAKARSMARSGGGNIAANSPWFDIIDGVARLWATEHTRNAARSPLERLSQRVDLGPVEKSMLFALRTLYHNSQGQDTLRRQVTRDWADAWTPSTAPGGWDIFAAITLWGFAQDVLDEERLAGLGAQVAKVLAAQGTADVAQALFEYQPYASGLGDTRSDAGLARMEALVHRIQQMFPADHAVQTMVLSQYASSLMQLGRTRQAGVVAKEAVGTYRRNPYHDVNSLAYLIAQQGYIALDDWAVSGSAQQGDIAVSLARTAYDTLDMETVRWDLLLDIVVIYMRALNSWGEHGAAEQIAKRHLPDLETVPRGLYHRSVVFLQDYAEIAISLGKPQVAREAYARAAALIPDETLTDREFRSGVDYRRGLLEWNEGAYADGFDRLSGSNAAFHESAAERARRAITGQLIETREARLRVATEAFMGWEYSLTLAEGAK